ncbi:RHS repeat-associated core domain-containing protein, partial [Streptococcus oralis]
RHMDKQDKLISSYGYEYDDGGYIAKETIKQDGETLVHTYTYDTLGQVENMTVSDGAGKELSKLSYTYDLAGNKLTSTETVDGKENQTRFTYDDHNRLTKLEGPDGTITYTYDKNGNRIASEKNSEKIDYIYDTENRLLAIKDKKGLLMAALYDGDDNRVFTASRKEGKNTYQLFQRKPKESKSGRKSPYTAPSGDQHSLFWYGFSQNVLQALSALPQTIGSIWHSIFDDVSTAYHQKVAKDRATKEGIVVNPPELGNLPGQGEVTYASQVQDVLIPYTTREDTYNYYEERNYVNDVNREHTEVLETYDHDGKARETYSYGKGRTSYLNNQTGDSYNYLINQSGSVTGLTKDGQAVASSRYNLYGARKASTDTTGNPFAYNGEARDDTGLDYLRARYYDSQGGTFLTEDSYPGEDTDPLSQNRYSYVQNNPVNYTDPSGHRMIWAVDGSEPSRPRRINTRLQRIYQQSIVGQDILGRPLTLREYTDHRIKTDRTFRAPESYYQAFGPNVATYQSSYAYAQQQAARARAQAEQRRRQQIRYEYGLATGINSSPTIREGLNLDRNWNTSLQNTLKHVCNTKTTKGQDDARKKHLTASELRQLVKKANSGDVSAIAALSRSYDGKSGIGTGIRTKEEIEAGNRRVWQNTVDGFKTINNIRNKVGNVVLELLSVNDVHRVITGEDPVTGEDASRIEAASSIILDIAALKLGKIAKGLKATKEALRGLDALNDASKVAKAADKAKDASKATKTVGSGIVGNSTSQRSLHARGYRPRLGERTFDGYVKNTVSIDTELKLYTNSPGFNSNNGVIGGQFKRFGSGSHGGLSPHVHQPQRNVAPNGNIYGTVGSKTTNGGVTKPEAKDIKQLYDYTNNGKYRE